MHVITLLFSIVAVKLELNSKNSYLKLGNLRSLLTARLTVMPMVKAIGRTMVLGRNYGPQISVKRLSTKACILNSKDHM